MASRGFWLQRQYLCQPLHIVVFARDLIVKFLQRFLKINMYCLLFENVTNLMHVLKPKTQKYQ